MSGGAQERKAWLEEKMRQWPKQGEEVKQLLREMSDMEGGAWLMSREFGLLVKGIEQVAFRGTTRSASSQLDTEMLEDMVEMLRTSKSETGATIKSVFKDFVDDYEVDGLREDANEEVQKVDQQPAKLDQKALQQSKTLLEEKMQTWPKYAEPIKSLMREICEVDEGAWVLSPQFHELVAMVGDDLKPLEVAVRNVGRRTAVEADMSTIEEIWMKLVASTSKPGATIGGVVEDFQKVYEEPKQAALSSDLLKQPVRLSEAAGDVAKLTVRKYAGRNGSNMLSELSDFDAHLGQWPDSVLVDFAICSGDLVNAPGGDRYLAVVQKGDGHVRALDIGSIDFVDKLIDEFLKSAAALMKKESRAWGCSLRKLVLDPVLEAAGSPSDLFISPFQKLSKLSFVMLPQDEETKDVLDMPVLFSYLHSASGLSTVHEVDRARARPSHDSTSLVIAGPAEPTASPDAAVLRVSKVLEDFCRTRTQTATLQEATREAASEGPSHPMVHCLSALRPADVTGTFLKGTQILVHPHRVEDATEFVESAMKGGAATVVLNLLDTNSDTAAQVTQALYALLGENKSVPAALKEAQLNLRKAGSPMKDWGGLVTYGNCEPLNLEPEGGRPAASRVFLTKPVRNKPLTEKVALEGGLEVLGSELCVTAFLNREAHKTRSLGIYVPTLKAAGPALPEDSPNGIRVILEGKADQQRQLSQREVVPFATSLLSTLDGAYSFGLLHGDLRPEHILWREDGCPLVAGFGASTDLSEWSADDPHQLAPDAKVSLKPWAASSEFAAPEVCGAYQVNPASLVATVRSDLWSFAKLVRHFGKEQVPAEVELILNDFCLIEDASQRADSFAGVRQKIQNTLPENERATSFRLPDQAPSDQHAVVTGVYRLVYDRMRSPDLRADAALQAVFPLRQLAHLLARAHSVVGSQQAETCARQALELAQRLSGRTELPEASDSLYHLGLAHLRRGRLADSETALRDSLRLCGAPEDPLVAGVASAQVAATFQALSSVLLRRGKLQDANNSANSALRTWEAVYQNKPHPGTAASLYHLGILLLERGETHKAEEMARRSLDMAVSVYGQYHRAPAASWHLLGSILLKDGKPVEAERAAQKSLEIRERLHGGTAHPDVAASLLLLGSVRDRGGKLEAAEEALLRALDMMQRLKGTDADLEISSAYRRLGSLRLIQGKPEQAETDMKEALKKSREVHGDHPHPDTIAALHTLGVLHFVQHKYEEAKVSVVQAQQMQQALHGPAAATHPRTKDLQNLLAEVEAAATGAKAPPELLPKQSAPNAAPQPEEQAPANGEAPNEALRLLLNSVRIDDRPQAPLGAPAFLASFPEFRDQWEHVAAAQRALEDAKIWPEDMKMTWYRLHNKDPAQAQIGVNKLVEWSGGPHQEKLVLQLALQLRTIQKDLERRLVEASTRKVELGDTTSTVTLSPFAREQALARLSCCDYGMSVAVLYWKGMAFSDASAYIRAERALRVALDMYEDASLDDSNASAALHFELGQLLADKGSLREAEEELTIAEGQQDPPGARVLHSLAAVQCERGKWQDAEASAQKALDRYGKESDHPLVGSVLVLLADIMRRLSKPSDCEDYASRALDFFQKQPESGRLADRGKAHNLLAYAFNEQGKHDLANEQEELAGQIPGSRLQDVNEDRELRYLLAELRQNIDALAKHNNEMATIRGSNAADSASTGNTLAISQTTKQVIDACLDFITPVTMDSQHESELLLRLQQVRELLLPLGRG